MTFRASLSTGWLSFVLALVASWGPARTWAQWTGAPASGSEAYRLLIEQALIEFKHKNWPEARVLFRKANGLSPNARTLRGMGVVSYEMRDYVQAVRDLSLALEEARQPLNPDQRAEAETLLARARTFVAVYRVTVEPDSAWVSLDGEEMVREPDGTVLMTLGEHVLAAQAEGYQAGRRQVNVQGGELGEVTLSLAPSYAEQAASEPASEDSPVVGASSEPPKGLNGEAESPSLRGLGYTWVALSGSAAFGGAAALFWALGAKKLERLDASCEGRGGEGRPCRADNTDTGSIERLQLMTNLSLGLSGACLVATGVFAMIEWPGKPERRLKASVGPTSVSVRGAF